MSGYELNDKDIDIVLENLRKVQPDATREDAIQKLLKTKMDAREKAQTDHAGLADDLEKLNSKEETEN